MPPCPFSPPPLALYVPWPWQAPIQWLVMLGLSLFMAWGVSWNIRQYRRQAQPETRARWRLFLVALSVTFSLPLAALFLQLLVVMPSTERLWQWSEAQWTPLQHSQAAYISCDTSDLNATFSHLIAPAHQTQSLVSDFIIAGGILLVVTRLIRPKPGAPHEGDNTAAQWS